MYVARAVVPVDAQGVDRVGGIIIGVKKLHNTRQIVGLTRRFAYKVYVVYGKSEMNNALQSQILMKSRCSITYLPRSELCHRPL